MGQSLIIVGAGPTGLVAAREASKQGVDTLVLEAGREPGGALSSVEAAGGSIERFYHHILPADGAAIELIRRLNLADGLRWHRGGSALWDGRYLHPMSGPLDLLRLPLLSPGERLRSLYGMALGRIRNPRDLIDEPVGKWVAGMQGEAAWHRLWRPMIRRRWGGLADLVPASWLAWRLAQRSAGGLGMLGRYGALDGGMIALVESLIERIEAAGGKLRLGCEVESVHRGRSGWMVKGEWGEAAADALILAVPAAALARISGDVPEPMRKATHELKTLAVAVALVEADGPFTPYYWINSIDPAGLACGAVEHTNLVGAAQYGGASLAHVPFYALPDDPMMKLPDDDLASGLAHELLRMSPSKPKVRNVRLFRYEHAHALRGSEFVAKLPELAAPREGLVWASDALVWPEDRGVSACVKAAVAAAGILRGARP